MNPRFLKSLKALLRPGALDQTSLEALRRLQDTLYAAVTGRKQPQPGLQIPGLPQVETDVFEDIGEDLRQMSEMLRSLERLLQRLELSFQDQIALEDAQERFIAQKMNLRRDWHQLLNRPYPATS